MIKLLQITAAFAAACMLSACGATGSSGSRGRPVSQGPTTIVKGSTPVQLYSHIARQVRSCWFNPTDPVLTKHVFRAEAGAASAGAKTTKVVIYDQAPNRKLGLKAFSIDFDPVAGGTRINAENHRLPYALGQKMVSDVGYWAQGGANCDGPVRASGGPRGSVSWPRVTR